MKNALMLTVAFSLFILLFAGEIEGKGRIIAIGCVTGSIIRLIAVLLLWLSVTGLLVIFLKEKKVDTKKGRSVKAVLLALAEVVLTPTIIQAINSTSESMA